MRTVVYRHMRLYEVRAAGMPRYTPRCEAVTPLHSAGLTIRSDIS